LWRFLITWVGSTYDRDTELTVGLTVTSDEDTFL
jgi:hypothetical protein